MFSLTLFIIAGIAFVLWILKVGEERLHNTWIVIIGGCILFAILDYIQTGTPFGGQ